MYIVTAEEMYDIDRYTMEQVGFDDRLLMENAGRAVCARVKSSITKADHISVFAGAGNNGGDGFVIARTLLTKGYHVTVVQVVSNEKVSGAALYHKNLFCKCSGSILVTRKPSDVREVVQQSDIVIDAILGIGTKGKLREPLNKVVATINDAAPYIISVDIPSGLPADEGEVDFETVQANHTIVIGLPKMSAFLQHTAPYYGKWEAVSIGLPLAALKPHKTRKVWSGEHFQSTMPRRMSGSHKGNHGKGLVVGGSAEFPGSIVMTAKAALKAGAGLITAATTEKVKQVIASHCPETTYLTLSETNGSLNGNHGILFENYDAVVLGMGLGRKQVTETLVTDTMEKAMCTLILDADGLYHIKSKHHLLQKRTHPTVITPHPGEMGMLLDVSVKRLLEKPFFYSKMFAEKYQIYVVLKGEYTIITSPDGKQAVNVVGNPGLAKGGTGDVLSGIILSMVMQRDNQDLFAALCNACFVHGKAADILVAETHSVYDLMASDVIEGIKKVYGAFLV